MGIYLEEMRGEIFFLRYLRLKRFFDSNSWNRVGKKFGVFIVSFLIVLV